MNDTVIKITIPHIRIISNTIGDVGFNFVIRKKEENTSANNM